MASSDLRAAEEQWREQFAAMRAALAGLNLSQTSKAVDADWDDDEFEGYSSGNSHQDVWDFISDDEEDDYSDFVDAEAAIQASASGYGAEWFEGRCSEVAAKNSLAPDVFQTQVMGVLTSGMPEEELQAHLTDLVGFEDLDFIIDILAHRDEVVATSFAEQQQARPSGRLLTKSEREDALRRQDLEHKTAALAPSYAKDPQYPHVYKAYSAGNTLSSSGKKYGLPVGSERHQFDKYEEYSVPAGRKGTLGPGERLIKISELDGLCRNTFKGYKTLNRMQSLVFPVAYRSNENMLICAPTGAVSAHPGCFVAQRLTSP